MSSHAYCAGMVRRVAAPDPDHALVERLRAGDEEAFMTLVRRLSPSLLRVARMYVPSQAVAEEVVQETWLGVLTGIGRFEGRSSLKTWIFRILVNRARTRGERERRTVPFAALAREEAEGDFAAVDLERFAPDGSWGAPPRRWEEDPELALRSEEAVAKVRGGGRASCPRCSVWSSRCATSRVWPARTFATLWTSPRPINACSCTARAPRCAPRSRTTIDDA